MLLPSTLIVLLSVITFNPYHLSIFTMMLILYLYFKTFSFPFQEWCSTHYALGRILSLVNYHPCFSSILYCAHALSCMSYSSPHLSMTLKK
jgi:hypothetical protein